MVRNWIVVGEQVVRVPVVATGKFVWNTQVLLGKVNSIHYTQLPNHTSKLKSL